MTRRLALVASLAFLVVACGDDDNRAATTSSTSSSSTSTSATTSSPTSATTDATLVTYRTPEAAAKCLFNAWVDDDKSTARTCAADIAVDELFSHPADGAETNMTYQGCAEEGLQFRCSWSYDGGAMGMLVVDSDVNGWLVSDLEYVAD